MLFFFVGDGFAAERLCHFVVAVRLDFCRINHIDRDDARVADRSGIFVRQREDRVGIAKHPFDRLGHGVCRAESGLRILHHRLENDLRDTDGNRQNDITRILRLVVDLHCRNCHRTARFKRQCAGNSLVKQNTDGIQIGIRTGFLAACLLGGDVINRSDRFVAAYCRRGRDLGNAEIHYLDLAVFLQDDVLRLDVAVNDTLAVRMLQGAQYLEDIDAGFVPRKRTLVIQILAQGDTVEILHNDIFDIGIDCDVVDAHDVFVRQHCDRLGLVDKAGLGLLVAVVFIVENLDCNGAVHYKVLRAQNARHTADADQLQNLIALVQDLSDKFTVIVHNSPYLSVSAMRWASCMVYVKIKCSGCSDQYGGNVIRSTVLIRSFDQLREPCAISGSTSFAAVASVGDTAYLILRDHVVKSVRAQEQALKRRNAVQIDLDLFVDTQRTQNNVAVGVYQCLFGRDQTFVQQILNKRVILGQCTKSVAVLYVQAAVSDVDGILSRVAE